MQPGPPSSREPLPPSGPHSAGQAAPLPLAAREAPPTGVFGGAPISLALLIVNVVLFVGEAVVSRTFDAIYPQVPTHIVMAFGGNYATATLYEGRIETLLTSCFVHFSLLHLAFNMVALRQVAPLLERAVGGGRFITLYFISGIVGSMVSTLYGWASTGQRLGAGASGAICGLIAAALVVGYRTQGMQSPLVRIMGRWLVFIGLFGLMPGVDVGAHVGGAIAGGIVAFVWQRGPEAAAMRAVALTSAVLLGVASASLVLLHDARDPFATLTADERLDVAKRALRQGRCGEARVAALAALRVAPRAPEVGDAIHTIRAYCGP